MSVLSGISGAINGIPGVRNWSIDTSADVQEYVDSGTSGGKSRTIGNTDWSGSYSSYGHTPGALPGDAFAFAGSIDGTNGASGTAIVDSIDVSIDIESGGIIEHTVNFSANGDLTLGAVAAADASVSDPPTAIGCKIELGTVVASPVWTEVPDVRTVSISIEAGNQAYVSSSTGGANRRLAGNVNATVSYTVYTDDFSDLPEPNDITAMRVYIDDTDYWEFLWLMYGEASGLEVNREDASPVGATLNTGMKGTTDVEGTPTTGSITDPSATEFWPGS
jgi:hypothetical protein